MTSPPTQKKILVPNLQRIKSSPNTAKSFRVYNIKRCNFKAFHPILMQFSPFNLFPFSFFSPIGHFSTLFNSFWVIIYHLVLEEIFTPRKLVRGTVSQTRIQSKQRLQSINMSLHFITSFRLIKGKGNMRRTSFSSLLTFV